MKKIVVLIVLALTIFSCTNVPKGEFLISGTAKGLPDGKIIALKVRNDFDKIVTMDSVKVKDGKFTLKGKVTEPNMLALFIQGVPQPIPFILETGAIDIKIDKDSIWKSEIGGTHNNDKFQEFNTTLNSFNKKLIAFQSKNMTKAMEYQKKKDKAGMESLNKGYGDIQKEMDNYMSKFPEENKDAYLSVVILETKLNAPNLDIEAVKKTFNALSADVKATKVGKRLQGKLTNFGKETDVKPETAIIGKQAPDFTAKNPKGEEVSLKQSMGKVTIIDFWASWCGPCRGENPNVVAMYNELHDKGLNIIGVSLDDNNQNWIDAIAKDKITWTQVSNLKKWKDPIAIQYGIQAIPATFILDANGVIVAKDLRGEELKAKIKELLGLK